MLKTSQKIRIAKLLNRIILGGRTILGLGNQVVVKRGGIKWMLDLNEGIDLSIWLLGGFEPQTLRQYEKLVKPGSVVLDVGANVGAHTLPFARLVGAHGRVFAFEPTKWAFNKLKRNLELNPAFSRRVYPIQGLLAAESGANLPTQIYSSWPLEECEGLHGQHKGRLMTTAGAVALTLDEAVAKASMTSVDFIKIDVDGNEYAVLKGAQETLMKFKPTILMELAPYVYDPEKGEFELLLDLIGKAGYGVFDMVTRKPMSVQPELLKRHIPAGGGINALLMPLC